MNTYTQLSREERYTMCMFLAKGFSKTEIAVAMNRSPSTIYRELERNKRSNGRYAASVAHNYYRGRLRRSRRGSTFSEDCWKEIFRLLRQKWSPEQIVDHMDKSFGINISVQTIYRRIKKDRRNGGFKYLDLRIMPKVRRKSYGNNDLRGKLSGKKHISTRPLEADNRTEIGHWEVDTVMGGNRHEWVLTMVDRKSGYGFIEKLRHRTAEEVLYAINRIIRTDPSKFKTLTFDNGTEFHSYKKIEELFNIQCYFATPHSPWQRGCNENYNGLLRQYLPKGKSFKNIGTAKLFKIMQALNDRPRKRHGFKPPKEIYLNGK